MAHGATRADRGTRSASPAVSAAASANFRRLSNGGVFLLDTNVVSELRRKRPHVAVLSWLRAIPSEQLLVSAVTIGEIQAGVEVTRATDQAKAIEIELWLDEQIPTFKIVSLDAAIFRAWAKLMHRVSDDHMMDGMIGATALVHKATVATRNVRDFKQFGVSTVNPFETPRQP
jgi:toxin FitB